MAEFLFKVLKKVVGKPFDNYVETVIRPAVGNHLWLFIVVPVSFALPWLIKHRERLPDWVFRGRAGQRQAALSVTIGLVLVALGTTPPFQPAGHGKIAGALAVHCRIRRSTIYPICRLRPRSTRRRGLRLSRSSRRA
jgi:hypothetical protein